MYIYIYSILFFQKLINTIEPLNNTKKLNKFDGMCASLELGFGTYEGFEWLRHAIDILWVTFFAFF